MLLLLLLSCFSCVRLCATPWMAAHQAPPSLGFSRQEYWSGVPLPSPACNYQIRSDQISRSVVSDSATPWIAARQASLSITNSWSSLRLNVHRVSDAIQPSHPLLSSSLVTINICKSENCSCYCWWRKSIQKGVKLAAWNKTCLINDEDKL